MNYRVINKRGAIRRGVALSLLAAAVPAFAAAPLSFVPYKATDIYGVGETVGWKVTPAAGETAASSYHYTIKKNGAEVIKEGTIALSSGAAAIEVSVNEPAMLYVQILPADGEVGGAAAKAGMREMNLGAAVAPEKLQPSVARPADFDDFWAGNLKRLSEVPANPVVTPEESGNPAIEYGMLKMDHVNGAHVYGHVATPKGEGKHPGLVIFQWASPPYPLQRSWVTDRAAEGWLAVNIEPHDVLPDGPKSYYDGLPQALKNYQSIGQGDRDKSYFLQMYLADYRAVEYVTSRTDWDGKTLVVMGTSMGGQQSLCVAGLHPRITHLIVDEPAGCDLNGGLHGRSVGYPFWPSNDAKVMAAAPYFDAVNFASHIHAKSLVAMGFVDTIAPPAGIWTAFDQIAAAKEPVPMVESPHNNFATPAQQEPYNRRSAEWLRTLVNGGDVLTSANKEGVGGDAEKTATVEGVERQDAASRMAHQQLVAKAKQGTIDVYFEGDSITRRWGTSDAQYKDFLANWHENFYGWNAADFGWGGDTVQNVLWRVQHGELDGVNPKVVVLMAGTNNLSKGTTADKVEAKVSEVTGGLQRIIATIQQKAPAAMVVVMGITPRGDYEGAMEVIRNINDHIASMADGTRVKYLNINDQFMDGEGHLKLGMLNGDKLHLGVDAYQVWANALKPVLTARLGPPAAVDSAPAPSAQPVIASINRGENSARATVKN